MRPRHADCVHHKQCCSSFCEKDSSLLRGKCGVPKTLYDGALAEGEVCDKSSGAPCELGFYCACTSEWIGQEGDCPERTCQRRGLEQSGSKCDTTEDCAGSLGCSNLDPATGFPTDTNRCIVLNSQNRK